MKALEIFILVEIVGSFPAFSSPSPVHCRWNPFGPWSECDGCTKTQIRRRTIAVYGQFGGLPCSGSLSESRPCVPTRGCPVEDGCGNRFRCSSGQCMSRSLVCNGDHDCEEDGADEDQCDEVKVVCENIRPPPNVELTGAGFDALTGESRGGVIHTKSFGGQCRKVFSGDQREYYRLSDSVLAYTFQVKIENDFSTEFYNSTWAYLKHTESRETAKDYYRYTHNENEESHSKSNHLMVIENSVEVAQFINNRPEFLTLAEPFWKELANLPSFYEYNAYQRLIERFGTHFLQSGSLGGHYKVLFHVATDSMTQRGLSITDMQTCVTKGWRFLFIRKTKRVCTKLDEVVRHSTGSSSNEVKADPFVEGGSPAAVAGLSYLNVQDPVANTERYSFWARSVSSYPKVIKQKITPLYELVKEVPCASVKRHHLKQAIEEYMSENDPCRCRPCQNGGQPVVDGTQCLCFCKPNTFGAACEQGNLLQDQPGVIDGGWSCWSSWSSCTGGRKSRSRSCNNPPPNGGGRSCIGETVESRPCEDEELQHFRSVEPHCFDISAFGTESCPSPPPLENGYVQDADSSYPVGKSIRYTCNHGYSLVGEPVALCGEGLVWTVGEKACQKTACLLPELEGGLSGAPVKPSYQIGEKIQLSCPDGMQLEGAALLLCEPSLKWSPNVNSIQCRRRVPSVTVTEPTAPDCQPWEKVQQTKCVCKMPYECGSSLDICATDQRTKRNTLLTVCKLHALECMGRQYVLVSKENCKTLTAVERACGSCHLWETCDEPNNRCTCREAGQCSSPGTSICVEAEGSVAQQTMTECEAGILKCRGENITIVGIRPCDGQSS
ncbi:complement component C7 [Hemicordylus capensis]|uniref:complement component C7 n=1 Tax=Hemicordylus capensis TaxID=884348 RepID=UPI0023038A1B|nr:complement component C7 [Hemicordylus capensis]XP_053145734.1 complement component C7 [Hemicordylus capensis]